MATIFHQGGWMMWPLLALSVLALAVICERALFFAGLGYPSQNIDSAINGALSRRDALALAEALPREHPVFGGFFGELRRACDTAPEGAMAGASGQAQEILDVFGQEIAARLDKRLPLLGVIVRAAPLMGLLGTVLGMINTFSRLAATQGGVDLMVLAEGIWQALITTAAGLLIAIPVLLVQYGFASRKKQVLDALFRTAGAVHALRGGDVEAGRAA